MVPCRQRPSWTETEANLFREVLHWSWLGARFFQRVNNNVQHVCDGWHVGGGGVCVKGIGSKMIVSVQSSKFKTQQETEILLVVLPAGPNFALSPSIDDFIFLLPSVCIKISFTVVGWLLLAGIAN